MLAQIYEIWDKDSKEVLFFCPDYKEKEVLKKTEDPYELSGFFPIPKPLCFSGKITSMIPISLYERYKTQSDELNRITARINALVKTLKLRGLYDSSITGISDILTAGDNEFIPADGLAGRLGDQSLEKALWVS